jgi:hypothetical protein
MLCVYVAGDELGTLIHDLRQNSLSVSVNRCHIDQLNNAFSRVPCVTLFSPSRLELSRPLADQLPLQRPSLLIGRISYSYPEHLLTFDCLSETIDI